MAQNTRKTHKKHCFFGFSTQFTPQKVHGRGDSEGYYFYDQGAPERRALVVFGALA